MISDIQESSIADIVFTSAQEVFSSMLGIEMNRHETRCELVREPPYDGILSVVGLTGAWVGRGFLRCTGRTACDLVARFLMMPMEQVNDEVLDGVGEITNMIVGSAKNQIEGHYGPIQISIPTVVYGKNLSTRSRKNELNVPVLCAYEGGEILLGICLGRA